MSSQNQYDIEKDRFVDLCSKFTGISKTNLNKYLETNTVSNLFAHPGAINITDTQRNKVLQLQEMRGLYNNLKSQDHVYTLNSSSRSGEYFKEFFYNTKDKEQFVCSFLDNSNQIIATKVMTTGTVNMSAVFPREICKAALLNDAASVILAHNHPGGSLKPSPEDITVTRQIDASLKTLKVQLLDHIIVTDRSFTSFQEKGISLTNEPDILSEASSFKYLAGDKMRENVIKQYNHESPVSGSLNYGRIDFLSNTGTVGETIYYKDKLSFDKEVSESNNIGRPISCHVEEVVKNLKDQIIDMYSKEFPAVRHISEKTVQSINTLNIENGKPLSIKDIKKAYTVAGKNLEANPNGTNMATFDKYKNVVDGLKQAQSLERKEKAQEKALLNPSKSKVMEMTQ